VSMRQYRPESYLKVMSGENWTGRRKLSLHLISN
jgi:hypothetical protein